MEAFDLLLLFYITFVIQSSGKVFYPWKRVKKVVENPFFHKKVLENLVENVLEWIGKQ